MKSYTKYFRPYTIVITFCDLLIKFSLITYLTVKTHLVFDMFKTINQMLTHTHIHTHTHIYIYIN